METRETPILEEPKSRQLIMRYAGGLVRHLGLQMYAGAVPAIAELVANAWDADAPNVWIEIPLDEPFADGSEIRVRDDGAGMTFDEANEKYLVVGRDRRASGPSYTPGDRRIMGRKGLGKLAGFGAAHVVEVWTVKDGHLTAFRMDYEQIVKSADTPLVEPYTPEILADRPVADGDPIDHGTMIVLKRIQLRKAVNSRQFKISMSRRFAVLSDQFKVHLNDEPLTKQQMEFQFRFPEKGLETADIEGAGDVRWWAGFTKQPIGDEEARGVSVLARGKLVQTPFFFDLSGGAHGQFGMQYLTGEVEADFLDDEVDLIATDRSSVLWEHPRAKPLLEWGEQKIKDLLGQWADKRREGNVKTLRDTNPYMARLERFPEREQRELRSAITKLASIETIDQERLDELVSFLFKAYENETFMELIRTISATDEGAQQELLRLFDEWGVLEAVSAAQNVRGRIEVIRKFGELIKENAPEKPHMQDFVAVRPWLMNLRWDTLEHERSLDRVLAEHFGVEQDPDYDGDDGSKRLDFLCMADSSQVVVVELKRPGDLIGLDELGQLERYVDYLRTRDRETTDPDRRRFITGCLVYGRLKPEAEEKKRRLGEDQMTVVTWSRLLEDAERFHREFLELVKSRAPADDPRVQELDIDGASDGDDQGGA